MLTLTSDCRLRYKFLTSVLMKSDNVYEGTVGKKVEIRCPYSDDYKYTPKYLCQDPCGSSGHVLIKSAKTDQVISDGRYSLIDIVSGRFFTVTISDLTLKDSGVYYCGVDKWFRDKLNKVNLSVRQAPVNRPSHTSEKTITTTTNTSTWTTTTLNSTISRLVSSSHPLSSQRQSFFSVAVVCAGVLALLVFGVLVAVVFLCWKRSHSTSGGLNCGVPENSVQDSPDLSRTVYDVHHIYDELVTENSPPGPARDAYSPVLYSTVQHCAPVNDLYSLITHH
ncbi:CMRF35-like molecule 1 isoform X2 [Pimephales promelas]|uniref:CMRF35-like molecule 1 isoform X2 n=1 Tax=Pimephales promelas TaxID=90988 RepID=UPI00195586B4|nr:CMRF35-like molecule 1 isoform X2 [Pimephales promelas]